MKNHRFILEPYKGTRTRHRCPACEHKNEFARYIDIENKYSFPDYVGRCNRESTCGYHYTPKQFFNDYPIEKATISDKQELDIMQKQYFFQTEKPTEYFEKKTMLRTMSNYQLNTFTNALQATFNSNQIDNIIKRYCLGTTRDGGVIFWQIDVMGRIRYGKKMYYRSDLHRDKTRHPVGVHSLMGLYDFKHKQCFFGEHLLNIPKNKEKAVAVLESEKSACICSELLPDYIWLATGGKNGCKWTDKNVFNVLKDRIVILFPDVDAHYQWIEKAEILKENGIYVMIYEDLAKIAPGTQQDIADHLILDLQRKKLNLSNNSDETPENKILKRMTEKNPLLSKFIDVFDCEITKVSEYQPLSNEEIGKLTEKIPDYNSFSIKEISAMLSIETFRVDELIKKQAVYFVRQTNKYCKSEGVPF